MRPLLFFFAAATCFAQIGPLPPTPAFPPDLKAYLSLTDSQVQTIVGINSDYARSVAEKQAGLVRLQQQLAAELAKPNLDPMGIGLAYGSMELIRRQNADALKAAQAATVAVLTDAQKAKLKALDDAMKLQPLISQAVCENLLVQQPATAGVIRTGDFTSTSGTAISGIASFVVGTPCALVPVITPVPVAPQP